LNLTSEAMLPRLGEAIERGRREGDARLRYDLLSAFEVIPVHQRRHLWQAERALARVGRPPASRP
jgi:hypothetical protein